MPRVTWPRLALVAGGRGLTPAAWGLQAERVMCQLREENKTDLQRYSILNQLLSSNQTLYYKVNLPLPPTGPMPCRPHARTHLFIYCNLSLVPCAACGAAGQAASLAFPAAVMPPLLVDAPRAGRRAARSRKRAASAAG